MIIKYINASPNKSGCPYTNVECIIGNNEKINSDDIKNSFSFFIFNTLINFFINMEKVIIIYGIKTITVLIKYALIVLFEKLNKTSGKNDINVPYSPDHVEPIKFLIPSSIFMLKNSSAPICKL